MRRVLRVGKDAKRRRARVKELMALNLSDLEVDMKLQFAIPDSRFTRLVLAIDILSDDSLGQPHQFPSAFLQLATETVVSGFYLLIFLIELLNVFQKALPIVQFHAFIRRNRISLRPRIRCLNLSLPLQRIQRG